MSTATITAPTAVDAVAEVLATVTPVRKSKAVKEAPVSIDTQTKSTALSALIEESATATNSGDAAKGAVDGFESAYASMITRWSEALAAGNTEKDIRAALQADQKQSQTVHSGAAPATCQTLTSLAGIIVLDGDLTEGYVWRPASTTGGVGIAKEEESLSALVRAVRAPAEAADLKNAGQAALYGKPLVDGIIAAATTKGEAIEGLLKAKSAIKAALAAAKKAETDPKDAVKYLKSAAGPLGKVQEALDAGLVGDADTVRTLIAEAQALLIAAAAHPALTVTV